MLMKAAEVPPKLEKKKYRRRFFMHYNKQKKMMTVHWKGQCIPVNDITCYAPVETKWNSKQPHIVMQGWALDVLVLKERAYILE